MEYKFDTFVSALISVIILPAVLVYALFKKEHRKDLIEKSLGAFVMLIVGVFMLFMFLMHGIYVMITGE